MTRYRLGERVRNRKLTLRYLRVGMLASILILGTDLGVTQIAPSNITRVLQLGTDHGQAAPAPINSTSPQRVGSSGPPPKGIVAASTQTQATTTPLRKTVGCGTVAPAHANLTTSSVPELRKLAQYEQLCSGAIAQRSSFFVPTPATQAEAVTAAQDVATILKAYAGAGVTPLVFMEPNDLSGNQLDLGQYASGAYDGPLISYFSSLKSAGITAGMMGMWVYVPEGNLPLWSTTDPATVSAVITKTAQFQKQAFPGSQASMMLDSESYAPGASWGEGTYVSLTPYVQNIPKGLLDSFGLQGFPWAAPANQPGQASLYDPAAYLRTDLAVEAAQMLGTTNIWFNTGTFGTMYASQGAATVTVGSSKRQQMLDGVIQGAKAVRAKGFAVAVHLFAENKSRVAEATDWSYWLAIPGDSPNSPVLMTCISDLSTAGIQFWLFDS